MQTHGPLNGVHQLSSINETISRLILLPGGRVIIPIKLENADLIAKPTS